MPAGRQARGRLWSAAAATLAVLGACSPGGPEPGAAPGRGFGGAAAPAVTVVATRLAPQTFTDRFTALGTARANESIEVTSRTTSIITRINFREGQKVRTGELLVELDTKEASADLALAQANLQQIDSQYRRSKTLAATQVVSAADLEQLEAQVLSARAQVRAAEARLDTLYVRAPFDGTLGLRRVSLGDLVGPDTVMTTLDDSSPIKLEFNVPESFLATVTRGMQISAQSNVYPGRPFTGEVDIIDSRVDPVSRSVTVIARIPNGEGLLKPGMFLTVTLEKERDNVLLVPEEALVPRQGRQFVYVVEEGRAVEREVELGGRVPGLAEIRQGIAPGELVITQGTQRVRDGLPVMLASPG